jgi:hypothetical protein
VRSGREKRGDLRDDHREAVHVTCGGVESKRDIGIHHLQSGDESRAEQGTGRGEKGGRRNSYLRRSPVQSGVRETQELFGLINLSRFSKICQLDRLVLSPVSQPAKRQSDAEKERSAEVQGRDRVQRRDREREEGRTHIRDEEIGRLEVAMHVSFLMQEG